MWVEQYEAWHTRQDFSAFSFGSVQTSQATSPGAPVYSLGCGLFGLLLLFIWIISLSTIFTPGVLCTCALQRGHMLETKSNCKWRHFKQKEWPQGVVTGSLNVSMQMEQVKWFASEQGALADWELEAISAKRQEKITIKSQSLHFHQKKSHSLQNLLYFWYIYSSLYEINLNLKKRHAATPAHTQGQRLERGSFQLRNLH